MIDLLIIELLDDWLIVVNVCWMFDVCVDIMYYVWWLYFINVRYCWWLLLMLIDWIMFIDMFDWCLIEYVELCLFYFLFVWWMLMNEKFVMMFDVCVMFDDCV